MHELPAIRRESELPATTLPFTLVVEGIVMVIVFAVASTEAWSRMRMSGEADADGTDDAEDARDDTEEALLAW
jgi:hypothetical protein